MPAMRGADIVGIRRSRAALDFALRAGGGEVAKRSASKCPTCHYSRRGVVSIGFAASNKWTWTCQKCKSTGDAVGALAAARHGSPDCRALRGREFRALLAALGAHVAESNPAADAGGTAANRREWARAALARSELLSPPQAVLMAAAIATDFDPDRFYDFVVARARAHKPDTIRRIIARWQRRGIFARIAESAADGDGNAAERDAARWRAIYAVRRLFGPREGAGLLATFGFLALRRRAPTLTELAREAGCSASAARRWWRFWLAARLFGGRLSRLAAAVGRRRRAQDNGAMQMSLPLAAPVAAAAEIPRRRARVFSRRALHRRFRAARANSTAPARGQPPLAAPSFFLVARWSGFSRARYPAAAGGFRVFGGRIDGGAGANANTRDAAAENLPICCGKPVESLWKDRR